MIVLLDAGDAIILPARFSSSQLKPRPSCRAIKMLHAGGGTSALIYIRCDGESVFFLDAIKDAGCSEESTGIFLDGVTPDKFANIVMFSYAAPFL